MAFLDLSQAFDLLGYNRSMDKLRKLNVSLELIKLLQYGYAHQINSVRSAGAMSDAYQVDCGVRQGGFTSPTLFNLYIDGSIRAHSSQYEW